MILVVGVVDEPVTARVMLSLRDAERDFFFVDERTLGETVKFECVGPYLEDSVFVFEGWKLPVNGISSVFARLGVFPEKLKSNVSRRGVVAWLNVTSIPVINRPWAQMGNGLKTSQYTVIASEGFRVPHTVIGQSSSAFGVSGQNYVVKSLGGEHTVAQILNGPVSLSGDGQIQDPIYGTNIRVHQIGQTSLALAAQTAAFDYRFAGLNGDELEFLPYDLPKPVSLACQRLMSKCGLSFAGIDLIRAEEWYCLEVNPSPGYCWFEDLGQQNISAHLVAALDSPNS